LNAVFYIIAALLDVLGLMFIIGAPGPPLRFVGGTVLFAASGGFIFRAGARPRNTTVVHQIDLPGDVRLEEFKCRECGAQLGRDSIDMKVGALFVRCGHCGAEYQTEEAPKW
jgi:hypothetical protein